MADRNITVDPTEAAMCFKVSRAHIEDAGACACGEGLCDFHLTDLKYVRELNSSEIDVTPRYDSSGQDIRHYVASKNVSLEVPIRNITGYVKKGFIEIFSSPAGFPKTRLRRRASMR